MNIYKKLQGQARELLNPTDENGFKPLLMDDAATDSIMFWESYNSSPNYWEEWIIKNINENKYNWFDFSKDLVDIGAGVGEYPIYTNFHKCYAFEPSTCTRYLMCANIASHDKIEQVIPMPYAISDNPGTRGFTGWSENTETGSTRKEAGKTDIEYRTLDSFEFDNVGFIKVDIEGYEYNALHSGLKTLIKNDYPPLLVEMWSDNCINNFFGDEETRDFYKGQEAKLREFLFALDYVHIVDKSLCDWMTYFFIHKTHLHNFDGQCYHPKL